MPIGGPSPMRVPRRCSVTTTPRRRSSARPAATVAGLRPTSAARRRTEGSRCPGASAPLRDRRLDARHELRCAARLDPILFQLSH